MQHFPFILLFYLVYLGGALFLLTAVARRRRKQALDYILMGLIGLFVVMVLGRITHLVTLHFTGQIITAWEPLVGILASLASIMFYAFCEYFPRGTQSKRAPWVLLVLTLISLALVPFYFSSEYIRQQYVLGGWYFEVYGPYLIYAACWRLVINLSGIGLMTVKYFKMPPGLDKFQIRFFLIGLVLCLAVMEGVDFAHALLSPQYIHYYRVLAQFSMLLVIGAFIYLLAMYRAADLQLLALKRFLKVLLSFGAGTFVYSLFFFFHAYMGEAAFSWSVLLLSVLVSVIALILLSNLRPKIDRFFFGKPVRAEEVILQLFYQQDFAPSFGAQLSEIMRRFQKCFPVQKALILAHDRFGEAHVHFEHITATMIQSIQTQGMEELQHLTETYRSGGDTLDRVLAIQDNSERLTTFAAQDFCFLLPLIYRGQVMGYFILGERAEGRPYSEQDLQLLDAVRLAMALFLWNFSSYEEIQTLKKRAETGVEKLSEFVASRQLQAAPSRSVPPLRYQGQTMKGLLHQLNKFARQSHPLLVTGETGTGKEMMAHLLHEARDGQPFVAINCAAVSDSLWESEVFGHRRGAFTDAKRDYPGRIAQAGAGTLFFDEVGEMPVVVQAKLLRLLQEKQYSPVGSAEVATAACRFIFATNRNLDAEVAAGRFREDLYYRINVLRIHVPPLRERKEDIPVLAQAFLRRYAEELGVEVEEITPEALQQLCDYDWPGNVRELENTLIRALASCESGRLDRKDIHLRSRTSLHHQRVAPHVRGNYEALVNAYARQLIATTLEEAKGNKSKAAQLLGMKRGRLLYQMKQLELL